MFAGIELKINGCAVRVRLFVTKFVADTPAKASLLHMTNFNGAYGCGICEIKGASTKQGDGWCRSYAPSADAGTPPRRTNHSMCSQGEMGTERKPVTRHISGSSLANRSTIQFCHPFVGLRTKRSTACIAHTRNGPSCCCSYRRDARCFHWCREKDHASLVLRRPQGKVQWQGDAAAQPARLQADERRGLCLSACLSDCPFVRLLDCRCVCISVWASLFVCLFVRLFIYVFVCLSMRLCACLCLCIFVCWPVGQSFRQPVSSSAFSMSAV